MTSDAEANSLFWKAYATSILQLLTSGGATVGPNSRVYIASSNHSAIPGGNGVPQEITNWGIHSLANNLLDANGGVTFNPTAASGGYVQALALYLEAIKPVSRVPSNADTRIFADMNQTPQAANNINAQSMAQLQAAQANVDAADLKVTAALTAAAAKWAVDPNGKGTTPWLSWYPENAPQYVDALANYDNVKGVLILQTDEVYGPGVGQLTQDLKVLTNALNIKLPLNPGCVPPAPILRQTLTPPPPLHSVTMEASLDDITMDSGFALHFPTPLKLFTVPAYTITGYGAEIDAWMLTSMKSRAPVFSTTISSTVGREYRASALGHEEASGNAGLDMGIFSIGGGGSGSTDTSTFQFGKWVDEISLTLTVNFAQTMTITPGEWYVPPPPPPLSPS